MSESLQNFANQMVLTNPALNPTGFVQHIVNPNLKPNMLDNPLIKHAVEKSYDNNETIGNYKITKLDTNKYAVSVNNGNMGAKICTKDEVDALKKHVHEQNYSNVQTASENYNRALMNINKS